VKVVDRWVCGGLVNSGDALRIKELTGDRSTGPRSSVRERRKFIEPGGPIISTARREMERVGVRRDSI
jgi:hypothetical protein